MKENTIQRMTRLRMVPKTRCDRRRAMRETKIIVGILLPIEMEFNKEILSADIAYRASYDYYLTRWQCAIDRIKHMDLRIVIPVADYFATQYRPQETE